MAIYLVALTNLDTHEERIEEIECHNPHDARISALHRMFDEQGWRNTLCCRVEDVREAAPEVEPPAILPNNKLRRGDRCICLECIPRGKENTS